MYIPIKFLTKAEAYGKIGSLNLMKEINQYFVLFLNPASSSFFYPLMGIQVHFWEIA